MTKLDLALSKLKTLPPERQAEIIDMLIDAVDDPGAPTALSAQEAAELTRRRDDAGAGAEHKDVVAMIGQRWP